MEREIIVQLPAYQTYNANGGALNAGVNKISNSEWEVYLKEPIIVNNGDTINLRGAVLDTRQTNSNAVIIEQDTPLSLEYYFYMMLPPDMWSDPLQPTQGGGYTINPLTWYKNLFASTQKEIMAFPDINTGKLLTPLYSYTNGAPTNINSTNQCLPFEIPLLLVNAVPTSAGVYVPITKTWTYTLPAGRYQYDELALLLTRKMAQIPVPLNTLNAFSSTTGNAFLCGEVGLNYDPTSATNPADQSYSTSYNAQAGFFTEFLSDVSVPAQYTGGISSPPPTFTNPFSMVAGATMLLQDAPNDYQNRTLFANQVVGASEISLVFNDQAGIFEWQYLHTPLQSPANVVEPTAGQAGVNQGAAIESVMICGAINNCTSNVLGQNIFASWNAPEAEGGFPATMIIGTQYTIVALGTIYLYGPNTFWNLVGGRIGAQVGDIFIATAASFPEYIQPPNGDAGFAGGSLVLPPPNPNAPSLTQNICRYTKASGVIFKQMNPPQFWGDILGFDVNKLCATQNELTNRKMTFARYSEITTSGFMGQAQNFDFNIKPIIPNITQTPVPDWYAYNPLNIQNTTPQSSTGVASNISVEQMMTVATAVASLNINTEVPPANTQTFFPFTFTSVATVPVEASNFPIASKDTSGHSLIEITMGYNNQMINNQGSYNIKGVAYNYYQSAGSFSYQVFSDPYTYQHFGEPQQLSSIKCRILDPITMTNLVGLGGNSCVYLQVTKQITDAEVQQVAP